MASGHQQKMDTGAHVALTMTDMISDPTEEWGTGEESDASTTSTRQEDLSPKEEILEVVEEQEDSEQLNKTLTGSSSSRRSGGDVRSLLHFVSVVGGDIKAALDKSAPCKRSVDHRKYLQKQLCRLSSGAPANSPAGPAPSSSNNHHQYQQPHQYTHAHLQQQQHHYHHHHHYPGNTSVEEPPNTCSPPPTAAQTLQQAAPGRSSPSRYPGVPYEGGATQSAEEQLSGRSGANDEEQCGGGGADNRRAPHDATREHRHCDHLSPPPQPLNAAQVRYSPPAASPHCQPPPARQSPISHQTLDQQRTPSLRRRVASGLKSDSVEEHKLQLKYVAHCGVGPPQLSERVPCDEQLVIDIAETGESRRNFSPHVGQQQQLVHSQGGLVKAERSPTTPRVWSAACSPAAGQCMASTPAGVSPPLTAAGSSSSSSSSSPPAHLSPPASGSSTPPSSSTTPTMVVASPVSETAADKLRQDHADPPMVATSSTRSSGDGSIGGFILPPEVTDDRDPLFEVPGVVDPTRRRDVESKDRTATGGQKTSIPLRQRQLPASFWKEPRPEERRAARAGPHLEVCTPATAAELLTAHGAFFVPNPTTATLQGCKSLAYDNYKVMADLYGARYQGLLGEAATSHRSAGGGGATPGAGLPHPDYLLSAYGSKLPTVPGVSGDPTTLSVVATAAAYQSGGFYPWPCNVLSGEAEKALAARLQCAAPHHHHHHQSQQHQRQHHHQVAPQAPPPPHHHALLSTPSSVSPHHVVHGHALLYHRQSALTNNSGNNSSTTVSSSAGASRAALGSPPTHSHHHGAGSTPPQAAALWDPLAALTAQSLLRQPPAAVSLWRPIPTKTLSSYQSRFHPFADVH